MSTFRFIYRGPQPNMSSFSFYSPFSPIRIRTISTFSSLDGSFLLATLPPNPLPQRLPSLLPSKESVVVIILKSTSSITILIPTSDRFERMTFPPLVEVTVAVLNEQQPLIINTDQVVEVYSCSDDHINSTAATAEAALKRAIRSPFFSAEECRKVFEKDSLLTIKPFFRGDFITALREELNSTVHKNVGPFDYRSYGTPVTLSDCCNSKKTLELFNFLDVILSTTTNNNNNSFISVIKSLTALEDYSLLLEGWEFTLVGRHSYQLLNSTHSKPIQGDNRVHVYVSIRSCVGEDECVGGDLVYLVDNGSEVGRLYLGDNQVDVVFLNSEDRYEKFISYKSGLDGVDYYRIHLSYVIN